VSKSSHEHRTAVWVEIDPVLMHRKFPRDHYVRLEICRTTGLVEYD
jgi:hypothetical protein